MISSLLPLSHRAVSAAGPNDVEGVGVGHSRGAGQVLGHGAGREEAQEGQHGAAGVDSLDSVDSVDSRYLGTRISRHVCLLPRPGTEWSLISHWC